MSHCLFWVAFMLTASVEAQGRIQAAVTPPNYFVAKNGGSLFSFGRNWCELFSGDIDGDGRPEILHGIDLVGGTGPTFSYRRVLGNGAWSQGPSFVGSGAGLFTRCVVVAIGDVDGNGTIDAIMDRRYQPTPPGFLTPLPLVLWLGDGSGGFSDGSARLPNVPLWVESALLDDVDSDGDLDLFLGARPSCLLYINDGTGTFTDESSARLPPFLAFGPGCVAPIDADHDGDRDLFVMFSGSSPYPTYLFVNQGGLYTGVNQGLGGSGAVALPLDANADGWEDVLAVYDARAPALFLSVAGQTVMQQAPSMVPVSGLGFFAGATSAALDVDHDGDLDVVRDAGSRIFLWINTGSGFVDQSVYLPANALRSYLNKCHVDFDLDGDQDLLLGATTSTELWLSSTHREVIPITQPARGSVHKIAFTGLRDHVMWVGASFVPAQFAIPGLGWAFLDPGQTMLVATLVFASREQHVVSVAIPNDPALAGLPLGFQALDYDFATGGLQTTNCPWQTIL